MKVTSLLLILALAACSTAKPPTTATESQALCDIWGRHIVRPHRDDTYETRLQSEDAYLEYLKQCVEGIA